ncbi:ATPase, F1 complex, delta/epsilon subunit [Bacteroides coprosuis DSM 18011]|uniref:ATPase, F1 complex, delta/epsilon subunit n=2 Tax=Bacteroides TaxID=816 RepID=F3ZUS5_9BACE|nr:ATPase, F1 complex, delta/epsilon subunit [Bacteroides coprosuis DSM 18011]
MMKLSIVSPERELFKGEIKEINLPGTKGKFTILTNHAPLVSSLEKGEVHYTTIEGIEYSLEIEEGFIEVSNNVVSVCVS